MEEAVVYFIIAIVAFIIGVLITRWVYRIDYICSRLTAMSNNNSQGYYDFELKGGGARTIAHLLRKLSTY